MYLEDSGGKFPSGAGASGDWPDKLRPYYKERGALTLCPSAKKPYTDGGKVPFGAWRWRPEGGGWTDFESKPGDDYGSYGMNEWLGDRPGDNFWRHREQRKANNIPMFFDCVFIDEEGWFEGALDVQLAPQLQYSRYLEHSRWCATRGLAAMDERI